MKTMKFDFCELTWDDELKPGDLITTYCKGYFTFVRFEDRIGNSPEAYFTKTYDVGGKPCKSKKIIGCDASFCRKAADQIKADIWKRKNEIVALMRVLKEISNVQR